MVRSRLMSVPNRFRYHPGVGLKNAFSKKIDAWHAWRRTQRRISPYSTYSVGRSRLRLCPHFVRNALRYGEGARNAAEFLDSWTHPQDPGKLLSSCSNRIDSNPRARLSFHVLVSEFRCFPGDSIDAQMALSEPALAIVDAYIVEMPSERRIKS